MSQGLAPMPSFEEVLARLEKSKGQGAEPVVVLELVKLHRAYASTIAAQRTHLAAHARTIADLRARQTSLIAALNRARKATRCPGTE